jgi:hypothetical protein
MKWRFQKQYFVILVLETWSIIADTDQNNISGNKASMEQYVPTLVPFILSTLSHSSNYEVD